MSREVGQCHSVIRCFSYLHRCVNTSKSHSTGFWDSTGFHLQQFSAVTVHVLPLVPEWFQLMMGDSLLSGSFCIYQASMPILLMVSVSGSGEFIDDGMEYSGITCRNCVIVWSTGYPSGDSCSIKSIPSSEEPFKTGVFFYQPLHTISFHHQWQWMFFRRVYLPLT